MRVTMTDLGNGIWTEEKDYCFNLYWDNDIVSLTKKEAVQVRDLLDNWIMAHPDLPVSLVHMYDSV